MCASSGAAWGRRGAGPAWTSADSRSEMRPTRRGGSRNQSSTICTLEKCVRLNPSGGGRSLAPGGPTAETDPWRETRCSRHRKAAHQRGNQVDSPRSLQSCSSWKHPGTEPGISLSCRAAGRLVPCHRSPDSSHISTSR